MELFDYDYGLNTDQVDNTEITTTILYFSKDELKEFKSLCKTGIKKEYNQDFQQKGNLPDLLLQLLRKEYGNN